MGKIYTSIEQLIGRTPLLELTHLEQELGLGARVLAKLEYFNPAGSVKDLSLIHILLKKGFDGAIIGTELLKKLNQSPEDMYAFIRTVSEVVEEAEPYVHCNL